MKRFFVVTVLLSLFVLGACSKKRKYTDVPSVQQNNTLDSLVGMDAIVDSAVWSTDSAYGYRVKYMGDSSRMDLYVSATRKVNDSVSTISFTIVNYTGVKEYTIDPPFTSAVYYRGSERHYATQGKITVESDGPYSIIGSFNFTADSVVVTNGIFNVAKP